MRARRTVASHLGAAACVGLLLSGATTPFVPLLCLVAIVVDTLWLAPRGFRPRPSVLLVLQLLLAGTFGCLALLRDPPVDFLTLLLLATAPLIVLRAGHEETEFNDFLIILLSILLVVGSAALAPGAMPILITAIYLLVGCQALRVLAAGRERPGRATIRLEERPGWWSAAPALAAHHLGMGGLLLGTLFYLVAPRPEAPAGGDAGSGGGLFSSGQERGTPGRGTSSLADFPKDVRLGDIGRLKHRTFPALQVEIREHGRPYDPKADEASMLLLRARAFERYVPQERRWEPPSTPAKRVPADGRIAPGDPEIDWSFDILGYDGRTIFLPPRALRVRAAGGALTYDRLGTVGSSVPVFQYSVASAWPPRTGDLPSLVPDGSERRLLEVPEAARRALERGLPVPKRASLHDAAIAISAYFLENGFRYTLDVPDAIDRSPDPLAAFLEVREGDCELYATTACLFLRMAGIPARVVAGLRCAERRGPGTYLARFSNAHAWVEVPVRGIGFVPLDFTPPDDTARPTASGGGESPEQEMGGPGGEGEGPLVDWCDPFDYGPDRQARVLDWLGDRFLGWPALLVAACALLLLGAAPVLAALRSRPRSPLSVTAPKGGSLRTLAFYGEWLRACAARGFVRIRAQTPREFLAILPPEMREEGARITGEFERRRYGEKA